MPSGRISSGRGDELANRHCLALLRVAVAIQERHMRTGIIRVTDLEDAAIRASMQLTMEVVRHASNTEILRAAEASLRRMKVAA